MVVTVGIDTEVSCAVTLPLPEKSEAFNLNEWAALFGPGTIEVKVTKSNWSEEDTLICGLKNCWFCPPKKAILLAPVPSLIL